MISSDTLTDISPLTALTEMAQLTLAGSKPGQGKLSDLQPLKDLKLTALDICNTEVDDCRHSMGWQGH